MGTYDVESSKYTKLKKAHVVEGGKYTKLKKAFVVEGGKYVKLWSGRPEATRWLHSTRSWDYVRASTNLSSWTKSNNLNFGSQGITFGDGKFYRYGAVTGGQNYRVYKFQYSLNGLAWTEYDTSKSISTGSTGANPGSCFCYLNKKLFWLFDGASNSGLTYFSYSTDGGNTWTNVNKPTTDTDMRHPVAIAYGLVEGYTAPKYFVYACTVVSGSGDFSDHIWVYDENFTYEATVAMPTVDGVTLKRHGYHYTSLLGVSNGSLKILTKGGGGYIRLAVYKNNTVTYKHKCSDTASTGASPVGGFVCTSEFTAWFYSSGKKFYIYDDSTDKVTEKDVSSSGITYFPSYGTKGCFDGERYIAAYNVQVFYTLDKGNTWTISSVDGSAATEVQCNIDGGGTWDPE